MNYRTFALDPADQPAVDRLDALHVARMDFREAAVEDTETRLRAARRIRELEIEALCVDVGRAEKLTPKQRDELAREIGSMPAFVQERLGELSRRATAPRLDAADPAAYAPDDARYARLGQHGTALFIRAAKAAPEGTVQRAMAEQLLAELPELARIDVRGDCTCAPGAECVCLRPARSNSRLDGVLLDDPAPLPLVGGIDLRKAARWIGSARTRELDADDRRPLYVEVLTAAARSVGEDDRIDAIKSAPLDDLRSAYNALPDPEPQDERTDMSHTDPESAARARMNAAAQAAWQTPPEHEAPNQHPSVHTDTVEREDAAEDQSLVDAGKPDAPTLKPGTPIDVLQQLITISKREGIELDALIRSLEQLSELQGGSADARTDAADGGDPEALARARATSAAQEAWQKPLATGVDQNADRQAVSNAALAERSTHKPIDCGAFMNDEDVVMHAQEARSATHLQIPTLTDASFEGMKKQRVEALTRQLERLQQQEPSPTPGGEAA